MTCDVYKHLWKNENLEEFGSIGQRQDGIDIFGVIGDSGKVGGIQCKCVAKLTPRDVDDEYTRSLNFDPALSSFLVVTTTKRDTAIQKRCVEITRDKECPCAVVFWDDFCQRLAEHEDVFRKYYSDAFRFAVEGDSAGKLIKIDIDVSHFEILVSRMPDSDTHYRGTILVSSLQNQKCITYRLGDHWSRLDGIVGITRCDAFLVSAWLNSFSEIHELLRLGDTVLSYELSEEDKAEAAQHGFHILTNY